MIKNYWKVAWRNLLRNPSTSVIHILGLSLGVSACLIIFLVTRFEFHFDTFHPNGTRIYRVTTLIHDHTGENHPMPLVPDPAAAAMRAELTGLAAVNYFYTWNASAEISHKKFTPRKKGEESPDIIVTEPQYFSIFKYEWLEGNPVSALSDPFHVVLTESGAHRYFGALPLDQVMGKEIVYEDSLHVTVSGIVRDWRENTDLGFSDFISYATVRNSFLKDAINPDNWHWWNGDGQTFVLLAPNVTATQVEKQFSAFVSNHIHLGPGDKVSLGLQPLSDIHFNATYEDTYSRQASLPTLYGLMGIALFILVIACINFINLSTARSIQRAREIGVRKVLGSGKSSLVLQFLSETGLLTGIAVVLSLLLTRPLLSALQDFLPEGVTVHVFSASTLFFLFGITIITSLAAGFYPARVLSSFLPALSLKGQGGTLLSRKSSLRKALIVFQFTVSLVFIIGTLVVGRQIHYMLNTDLGFNKDAIINMYTNRHYTDEQRQYFARQLLGIQGVKRVSINSGTPSAERHSSTRFTYNGKQIIEVKGEALCGDTGYLSLYQLKLVAGRNLMASDTMKEYLINETGARALGFKRPEDALGKFVQSGWSDGEFMKRLPIVGVVSDFHSKSLHAAIQPDFITTSLNNSSWVSVKLDRGQGDGLSGTLASIQKTWKAAYPDEKFDYAFFDDTIARFYKDEEKTARIIQIAMSVAIFISCMGLFGLATFTAQQRTKEIGIRKVMGASVSGIISLLCREFVLLVGISILIASPLAWLAMQHWLRDYAYRISIGAGVFVLAGMAALSIALLTVGFQAFKAARANPVKSLRTE